MDVAGRPMTLLRAASCELMGWRPRRPQTQHAQLPVQPACSWHPPAAILLDGIQPQRDRHPRKAPLKQAPHSLREDAPRQGLRASTLHAQLPPAFPHGKAQEPRSPFL